MIIAIYKPTGTQTIPLNFKCNLHEGEGILLLDIADTL